MKILFGDEVSGVWLAGSPDESVRAWSETIEFGTHAEFKTQPKEATRAEFSYEQYRGNARQVLAFNVKRTFATVADGEKFAARHIAAILAIMEAAKPDGVTVTIEYADAVKDQMTHCLARKFDPRPPITATVAVVYEIVGNPVEAS